MAIDLKAVFEVQDRGSAKLRRIMHQMDDMNKSSNKLTRAVAGSQRGMDKFNRSVGASNMSKLTSSISGTTKAVVGLVGAYTSVQGAKSLFESTIGQAMKFEQSEAIIKATFQDDGATKKYMNMVDKIAIDSPLLNSTDMFAGSKGMLTMTTDMSQLEKAWGIVERLIASDPTKNIDDAIRGMRELASGDTVSLREVFNLDKNTLNSVKSLSFEEQLAGIDKALTKMNITEKTVEAMGNTSAGLWAQLTERASKFFREMGGEGNDVLGKQFTKALAALDKVDLSSIASDLGSKLASGIQLAADTITFVKDNMEKFKGVLTFTKEVVIGLTAAFVAHKAILGGLMIYNAVATAINLYRNGMLAATVAQWAMNVAMNANPVGIVITAIAALIGIIVVLVRNWHTVTAATKKVWDAIGGGSGAIALVLGPLGFLINAAIDLAKHWDSTKSIWENVWGAIQRSAATSVNAVIGLINSLIGTLNKIPGVSIPLVAKVDWGSFNNPNATTSSVAKGTSGGGRHSHYHGIDYVPRNQWNATLHKGEAVLTAQENKQYQAAKEGGALGGVNIAKLADQIIIREDADVDRIAMTLAKKIEREFLQIGH